MKSSYETIIIGAGMSGLAAGIRLAMFGKSVCILERHSISGGLNSFYARKGRKIDVGLHALTNFATRGEKAKPLTKLLKQLRIPYSDLNLFEQSFSKVQFPDTEINFSNNLDVLKEEITKKFPKQKENFHSLLEVVENFDETNLDNPYESAKEKILNIIPDELLVDMILCPLLIYGSAWEDDMDFSQFVIMFKSIFLEGFSRPKGGVRSILKILQKKYKELGGEIYFNRGVSEIITHESSIKGIVLDDGSRIESQKVLSSMGLPETLSLIGETKDANHPVGKMSFTETILFFDKKPCADNIDETIIFYNANQRYHYKKPETLCDFDSAVICLPNNFKADDIDEGVIRITYIANFDKWNGLGESEYVKEKENVLSESMKLVEKVFPSFSGGLQFQDVFTPTTIKKYTGHFGGTVYGSTKKSRNGQTDINNLFICGTDQGFLGIVGSMLSGISMANLHCLKD